MHSFAPEIILVTILGLVVFLDAIANGNMMLFIFVYGTTFWTYFMFLKKEGDKSIFKK